MKKNWRKNKREALLVEYEVCEEDNAANFQGYWTLAAIFIGISSALLGGLVYAVIANDSLFSIIFYQNEPCKTSVVGIIAIIIGIANIEILKKLRGWHKRILQNQRINSGRMREIELELGMSRSWRYHALNIWYDVLRKGKNRKKCVQQKWDLLKEVLREGLDHKYHDKLENLKEELLKLIEQHFAQEGKSKYEPSSSIKHYPHILNTLILLWALIIAMFIFVIILPFVGLSWGIVFAIAVIILFIILLRCGKI